MEIIFIIIALMAAAAIGLLIKNRIVIEFFSLGASGLVVVEAFIIAFKVSTAGIYSPFIYLSVDSLGAIVMLLIACVGLAATVYSVPYLRQETEKGIIGLARVKQYFILLNIFILAMVLAVAANSPILAWLFIEATTLSTAFLISFYDKPSAIEGAWKYLIINSVGLLLGFFGTLLYFTSQSGSGFISWQTLVEHSAYLDPTIAKIAFVFVLIGFGTKVGLVPMHTWLPDAHGKAPVPISALLSGVLLNVAFITLLRFKLITDLAGESVFSQKLLMAFGLFSILIAAFIVFSQKNYKRLLAYSSIENMGMAALGFGFGGLGVLAAIFHLIYHSLIKSALFLSAGNIFLTYSSTKIAKIRGVITALPVTGVLFLAGFFAITGTPPFGIFLTKIFIISAGIQQHPLIAIIAILLTAVMFVGFFKQIMAMIFGKMPADIKIGKLSFWLILPPGALIFIALILSFYIPPFLLNLINDAVSRY